jgi:RNA polymerase sigma-70 factor (ECF subfamily)
MHEADDEALMGMVAAHCPDALGVLFARYQRLVFNYARLVLLDPQMAEDVLQDTFVAVAAAAEGYRPEGHFRAWLMAICRHRCLALLERARTRARLIEASGFRLVERERVAPSPAEGYACRERLSDALLALEHLPPDQREAVTLSAVEGLGYAEIATVLQRPVNTVKTLVRRARLRLADALRHDTEARHALHP